jgi:hypothetical protein
MIQFKFYFKKKLGSYQYRYDMSSRGNLELTAKGDIL